MTELQWWLLRRLHKKGIPTPARFLRNAYQSKHPTVGRKAILVELHCLAEQGLVSRVDCIGGGWFLTDAGRSMVAATEAA